MKACNMASKRLRRAAVWLLCLLMVSALLLPLTAGAKEPEKTVRVGWYDSSYNNIDQFGRRSGYAYEYQIKLAAYTGWKYEYVTGSWSDLLQMLIDGEIDLMSDVSYTEERAEKILYPELPMGSEEYYVFTVPGHPTIVPGDFTTLNGMRIGVNKDSFQADCFREWAALRGIQAELIEVTTTEDESLRRMETGELDAYVTVDSFTDPTRAVPVSKVGASDFYFAVNKNRPDLLQELNSGMSKLWDENRYYNQQLHERFILGTGASTYLSTTETDWLAAHGTIRVGYQDNYLAFCAADRNGELTGTLKDFLNHAADCMTNAHLDFEPVAYPSSGSALAALARGEVDCVFPINLRAYDGEERNITITTPLTNTDMYAVVRSAEQQLFLKREHLIVAVNAGNPNYDAFLLDHYPNWQKVYFQTTEECLKAVKEGVADCVLISSFRYNNISRICEKYRLTTLSTGIGLDYCFAVQKGSTELYSILTKAIELVPSSTVNAALSYYVTEDARLTFGDIIAENIWIVMAAVAVVVLAILALLLRSIHSERKAKRLIAATETDSLTGLYSRNYFFEYANRSYREHPEKPMDAIVLNIEQFHAVNASKGWDFGDQVLRTLGSEARAVADELGGIAGRFGADRFDIYCRHTEHHEAIFDRLQNKLDALTPGASIRLRMGVAAGQEGIEPVQLFDRARTACNMARGHYQKHLIVFDEKVRERELYEQRLLDDLRHALDSYQFEVYYQPKYAIQAEPPQFVGAEALVRWQHPALGMIAPADFIPLLERNGLVGELDKYVWAQATRQIARWRAQFGVTVPVSVNLSRVDVFDSMLEKTLDNLLFENGLEQGVLSLEVTESAYTENADQVVQVVESLRRKGYLVAMDDFGTGYSSLNMLSAMPVDVLKMDRKFIQNIEHEEKDVQLVALIVGIAKNLNVPVIAEGVETEPQLRLLKDLGCAQVQGFYFARPLHPSEFEDTILRGDRQA